MFWTHRAYHIDHDDKPISCINMRSVARCTQHSKKMTKLSLFDFPLTDQVSTPFSTSLFQLYLKLYLKLFFISW